MEPDVGACKATQRKEWGVLGSGPRDTPITSVYAKLDFSIMYGCRHLQRPVGPSHSPSSCPCRSRRATALPSVRHFRHGPHSGVGDCPTLQPHGVP